MPTIPRYVLGVGSRMARRLNSTNVKKVKKITKQKQENSHCHCKVAALFLTVQQQKESEASVYDNMNVRPLIQHIITFLSSILLQMDAC